MSVSKAKEELFEKLLGQFVKFLLKSNPVRSTLLGFHEFDEEFSDYAPGAVSKRLERLDEFSKSLKEISRRYLSTNNRIDLDLALGVIETEKIFLAKYPRHVIIPEIYIDEIEN